MTTIGSSVYLSRQQSTLFRGIAIIAIVLGHNLILQTLYWDMREYLYLFHLSLFFTLPFFYDKETVFKRKKILDLFIRCYVPYILFFTTSYLINAIVLHNVELHIITYLKGVIWVDNHISGVVFLWFLPAYFMCMLLQLLTRKLGPWSNYLFMICGLLMCIDWNYTWNVLFKQCPLGIMQGIYYFSLASTTRKIMSIVPKIVILGAIWFGVYTLLYFTTSISEYSNTWSRYFIDICAFMFFYMLSIYLCKYPNPGNKAISLFGKYSMGVYLTHVYIYVIVLPLFPFTTWGGIADLLVVLILSLGIAIVWQKIAFLQQLFLPTSWNDWALIRIRNKYLHKNNPI